MHGFHDITFEKLNILITFLGLLATFGHVLSTHPYSCSPWTGCQLSSLGESFLHFHSQQKLVECIFLYPKSVYHWAKEASHNVP